MVGVIRPLVGDVESGGNDERGARDDHQRGENAGNVDIDVNRLLSYSDTEKRCAKNLEIGLSVRRVGNDQSYGREPYKQDG